MLITLMLALALITIALLTALPEIGQQIRRDREEEMVHRGTAYMRAIQHFYKKFGRYPNRVEELENTNNLRFIRKRYTDPMSVDRATGKEKDFKFLHQQDISLNSGTVLGQTPGQNPLGGLGGIPGQPQGGFAGAQQAGGGLQGALGGALAQLGGIQRAGGTATPTPEAGDSDNPSNPDAEGNPNAQVSSSGTTSGFNGPVFGGGPILGVASTSKAKTIRVFYQKEHYNDWLFIYVPQADRGGLVTGPVNPGAPTGNIGGAALGQPITAAPGQGLTPNGGPSQGPQPQPQQPPTQPPPEQ
jgi:type II secretory pathway pseudopilin PulG